MIAITKKKKGLSCIPASYGHPQVEYFSPAPDKIRSLPAENALPDSPCKLNYY